MPKPKKTMDKLMPREFDCVDCGGHIFSFSGRKDPVEPNLCATCDWLRTVKDPIERAKLRQLLRKDIMT
jgi:hypothetical protein